VQATTGSVNKTRRLVILNGLPLSAIPYSDFTLEVRRIGLGELAELASSAREVRHYVRHPATVEVLSSVTGIDMKPVAENYAYSEGDTLVVVTVRNLARGQEMKVRPEDLDVFLVKVIH
jgi:hypothetical protein